MSVRQFRKRDRRRRVRIAFAILLLVGARYFGATPSQHQGAGGRFQIDSTHLSFAPPDARATARARKAPRTISDTFASALFSR